MSLSFKHTNHGTESWSGEPMERFKGCDRALRQSSIRSRAKRRRASRIKNGNALAVLALFYTCGKRAMVNLEIEKYMGRDFGDAISPVFGGMLAGAVYKCTRGPKQMLLYGIVSGLAMGAVSFASGQYQAQQAMRAGFGL